MISHNFRKLCNTSVCYTTLSNCCFCIFLSKIYKLSKRTILKKDVWDKEKVLSPHEESKLRLSNSTLWCPTTEPQRLYGEWGPLQSSYIYDIRFSLSHTCYQTKKHLSLFLNQAQNLPSLLFYLRTILFLINRTLWHGHGLALVGK